MAIAPEPIYSDVPTKSEVVLSRDVSVCTVTDVGTKKTDCVAIEMYLYSGSKLTTVAVILETPEHVDSVVKSLLFHKNQCWPIPK